jgi:hypothetical protein
MLIPEANMTTKLKLSYYDRMLLLPPGPYRDEMLRLSRQWLDEHFVTQFETMLGVMERMVGEFVPGAKVEPLDGEKPPGLAELKSLSNQMQRVQKLVQVSRDRAAYFAASAIFLRTGRRLPRVDDPCDSDEPQPAFEQPQAAEPAAGPLPAPEAAPAAQAQPEPAPESEQPVVVTGKCLKPMLHALIRHKVPPTQREEFKRLARSGRFTISQLRQKLHALLPVA